MTATPDYAPLTKAQVADAIAQAECHVRMVAEQWGASAEEAASMIEADGGMRAVLYVLGYNDADATQVLASMEG